MKDYQNSFAKYWLLGIVILIIGLGGTYLALYQKDSNFTPVPVNKNISQNPIQPTISGDEDKLSIEPYLIEVAWNTSLILQPEQKCTPEQNSKGGCDYSTRYLAGKIINGYLNGHDIYLREQADMGGNYYDHYVLYKGEKVILEENKFTFKGISDLPEEISYPGSVYKMKKFYSPSMLFSAVGPVKKLFTIPGLGDFYLTDFGCIMMELPNHTAIAYDFELPFVDTENNTINFSYINGIKNTEEYEFIRIGGCGATCMYLADVKEDVLKPNINLVKVAYTSNGEAMYQYKDDYNINLQNLYNDENTLPYMSDGTWERLPKSKYTYEQYINLHPLLYWKDPLGRWIEFKNKKFLIAAEKCKPVIYLYPTSVLDLNVQVKPNGGFTKTIPEYNDGGWNVKAYPNGDIIDLATQIEYPYLYWSGIGLNYPINEEEGWIVEKEKISSFLDDKLPVLGMNKKEIADFKEYWVAKLSDMPYYQISFLPKNQLDQMAPLTISPARPDSMIRVMMTAKELTQYKMIREQQLPETPQRKGFTVVEWGGVLIR